MSPLAPSLLARRARGLTAPEAWIASRRLTNGVCDADFTGLVARIDDAPLHQCPPTQLLVNGVEAFAVVGEALRNATEEILVETYILRDDRIGDDLRRELTAACHRGVRVCVLADGIGSLGTGRKYWHQLERAGITVRLFHPFLRAPLNALRRDHRKIFVIDRAVAFTGGMNIGEEYGSSIRSSSGVRTWRDTFIRVEGTVCRELAAVFAEGWDRAGGDALPGLEYVSWSDGIVAPPRGFAALGPRAIGARMRHRMGLVRDKRKGRRVRREAVAPATDAKGTVMVLDSRPGRGQPETLAVMAALVGGARSRLWITTPYFAPPLGAIDILTEAVSRGVDVRLLLPGPTDVAIIRHAAHGAFQRLLRGGVRVFEYQPAVLHAKTMVVDGRVGVVGSANLDFRSFWLNAECNLLLFEPVTAEALETAYQDDLSQSLEITLSFWKTRSWWHRALDSSARAFWWAL